MTYATTIDAQTTTPDIAQEVMCRLAAQVLAMGQQHFEQVMQEPAEEDYNYDDVEDDEGDGE